MSISPPCPAVSAQQLGAAVCAKRTGVRSFLTFCGLSILLSLTGCLSSTIDGDDETEPELPSITITSVTGVPMSFIPGGTFEMGSGEGDEGPRHQVSVSPFLMDQFEVRQLELAALEMPDASHFKDPDRPVEMIRWSEAAMVCNRRSKKEGLEPCYDEFDFGCNFSASGYRLPTEAEWEFAARAGSNEPFPPTQEVTKLTAKACYAGNSNRKTDQVGQKRANAWGLYDMLGNVAEWCNDVYVDRYEASDGPVVDPRGPSAGEQRVLRGGSWESSAEFCRPTARMSDDPGIDDACFAHDRYGFRMVRRPTAQELDRYRAALAESSTSEPAAAESQ